MIKLECVRLAYIKVHNYQGFSFEKFFISPVKSSLDHGMATRNLICFGENSAGKTSLGQMMSLLSYTPYMQHIKASRDGTQTLGASRFEKLKDRNFEENFTKKPEWVVRFALLLDTTHVKRSKMIFFEIVSLSNDCSITTLLNNEKMEEEEFGIDDFSSENIGEIYNNRFKKNNIYIKSYDFYDESDDFFVRFSVNYIKQGYYLTQDDNKKETNNDKYLVDSDNDDHLKRLDLFLDSRLEFFKLMNSKTHSVSPKGRVFYFNSDLNDFGTLDIRETLKDFSSEKFTEYLAKRGWNHIFCDVAFREAVHKDLKQIYDDNYLLHIVDNKKGQIGLEWENHEDGRRKKVTSLSSGSNEAFWICCLMNINSIIGTNPLLILDEPCMHMAEDKKLNLYKLIAKKAFSEKNYRGRKRLSPNFQLILITHNLSTIGLFTPKFPEGNICPYNWPLLTYLRRDREAPDGGIIKLRNCSKYKSNRFAPDSLESLLLTQIKAQGDSIELSNIIEKLGELSNNNEKRIKHLIKILTVYTFLNDSIKNYEKEYNFPWEL